MEIPLVVILKIKELKNKILEERENSSLSVCVSFKSMKLQALEIELFNLIENL